MNGDDRAGRKRAERLVEVCSFIVLVTILLAELFACVSK